MVEETTCVGSRLFMHVDCILRATPAYRAGFHGTDDPAAGNAWIFGHHVWHDVRGHAQHPVSGLVYSNWRVIFEDLVAVRGSLTAGKVETLGCPAPSKCAS